MGRADPRGGILWHHSALTKTCEQALNALVDPAVKFPWGKTPLLRVIIRAPEDLQESASVELVAEIYFTRLLFYLIADEHIQAVMANLRPSSPVVQPLSALASHARVFASGSGARASPFTSAGRK